MTFVTGLAQVESVQAITSIINAFCCFSREQFLDYGLELANATVSNLAMTIGGFGELLKNRSEKTGVVMCYGPLIARFLLPC